MLKKKAGFTLMELLIVTAIILLMTSFVLANYRRGEEAFSLQRATHKLAQDLRNAAEMAMVGREYEGTFPLGGYGLYFPGSDSSYILFADNGNFQYDSGDLEIKTLFLEEKGVKISAIFPGPPLSIVFSPPGPKVNISPGGFSKATIDLTQKGETRRVKVNIVGLIDID